MSLKRTQTTSDTTIFGVSSDNMSVICKRFDDFYAIDIDTGGTAISLFVDVEDIEGVLDILRAPQDLDCRKTNK